MPILPCTLGKLDDPAREQATQVPGGHTARRIGGQAGVCCERVLVSLPASTAATV